MIKNPFEKFFQQNEIKLEKCEGFPSETIETFEKERIKLPIYEVEIELPENCFFRNDGIVESLSEHTEKVLKEFGMNSEEHLSEKDYEDLNRTTGHNRCVQISDSLGEILGRFSITFILPKNENRGDEYQIFNESHEIAHAMHRFGDSVSSDFAEKIFQKANVQINIDGLDEETVCIIMGLLAMKIHNIPMDAFNKHDELREAYDVLQELIKKYPKPYITQQRDKRLRDK